MPTARSLPFLPALPPPVALQTTLQAETASRRPRSLVTSDSTAWPQVFPPPSLVTVSHGQGRSAVDNEGMADDVAAVGVGEEESGPCYLVWLACTSDWGRIGEGGKVLPCSLARNVHRREDHSRTDAVDLRSPRQRAPRDSKAARKMSTLTLIPSFAYDCESPFVMAITPALEAAY